MVAGQIMTAGAARRFDPALPQIFVTDFDESLRFYVETLGFEVGYTYGEPPFYGLVQRGAARVNLRHVDASPFLEGVRDRDALLSAAISVDDATALFAEYQARGVSMQQELARRPWAALDFVVRDPDGNLLGFSTLDDA